jgi:L-alanine-DL-glutamate epimerase-like enolase superfamily enzyme
MRAGQAVRVRTGIRSEPLLRPFRVSHTAVAEIGVVELRVDASGVEGRGVVALGPWRPDRADDVASLAARLAEGVLRGPLEIERVRSAMEPWWSRAPAAAQLAEMCLLDLIATVRGLPLWQVLDLPRPAGSLPLFRTLSLGETPPVAAGSGAPRLKVKLGGPADEVVLDALRGCGSTVLVDVNRGWTADDLRRLGPRLREVDLLAVEDPVREPELVPAVRGALPGVPVLLDEGVDSTAAVDAALAVADGVNLKLLKLGGLLPAIEAARRARRAGRQVMLGCFIEPSCSIGYAATMSGLADWHDLDGHTWLEPGWSPWRLDLDLAAPGPARLRQTPA